MSFLNNLIWISDFCDAILSFFRSSQRWCFIEKAYNYIKKETLAQVFSFEFSELFRNTFFEEHLQTTGSPPPFMIFETDYSFLDLCRIYLLTNEAEILQNNQI